MFGVYDPSVKINRSKMNVLRWTSQNIFSFMTGFWILMIVLMIWLGYFYFTKHIVKRRLFIQQKRIFINSQRITTLLDEKELLLKEIHHRVKNNLQTVLSLLESQLNYLQDDALEAIKSSRNRIFAMSLIFRNTYGSQESLLINMESYIPDLTNYIRETFEHSNNIEVDFLTEPLILDIGDAVALGIILNESLTNSMKYAYDGKHKCKITVTVKYLEKDVCLLLIADNGKGIPLKFFKDTPVTFGLKLILGLSKQLEADLDITVNQGTQLRLLLCPQKLRKTNVQISQQFRRLN